MEKRYILILSMIFVILSISCVSAADNGTDVIKEQNNNAILMNKTVMFHYFQQMKMFL